MSRNDAHGPEVHRQQEPPSSRPAIRVKAGRQVHQLRHAQRQEERGAAALLRRDGTDSETASQRKPDRGLQPRRRERQAADRGPFQASWRSDLSGPDAGQQEPAADTVDPLDLDGGPREEGAADGR